MRHELCFAGGEKNDFELALLALGQSGSVDLDLLGVCACVSDFERAAAADLEAVVEDRSGGDVVSAEAGAGVVNF